MSCQNFTVEMIKEFRIFSPISPQLGESLSGHTPASLWLLVLLLALVASLVREQDLRHQSAHQWLFSSS